MLNRISSSALTPAKKSIQAKVKRVRDKLVEIPNRRKQLQQNWKESIQVSHCLVQCAVIFVIVQKTCDQPKKKFPDKSLLKPTK